MGTTLLRPIADNIAKAADALTAGDVVAFPTDTVYGLGADARSDAAVTTLRKAKKKDDGKPLQVMVANMEQARCICEFSVQAEKIAAHFLPGKLTLIAIQKKNSNISTAVNNNCGTIGIRIPDYPPLQELLHICGFPVAASSANISGTPPAVSGREVADMLGDKGVGFILDATLAKDSRASTVLDCSGNKPRILREGAISAEEIFAVCSK